MSSITDLLYISVALDSLETSTTHPSGTAGELAEITSSSMITSNTTAITHYVNSDIVEITDVDTSTRTGTVNHEWASTMITIGVSDGHTTDEICKKFDASILSLICFLFILTC